LQTDVKLPQVELTMESATVTRWLVAEGDRVAAEQPLIEVETQKATSEVPSPAAGFVRRLCVKTGDVIAANAILCILTDGADEPIGTDAPPAGMKASPAARRVAKELGVNLTSLRGTGPDGRVTEQDVRAAASSQTSANDPQEWKPLPPTRLALIDQMQRSLREIPQIHLQRQLDVTPLLAKSNGITFTHRLIVAAASALRHHPALRTVLSNNQIRVEPISVAFAMDSPHGLVAPVIRNADQLSLEQVVEAVTSLKQKAATNTLRREDLTAAPFAISNLGMYGVDLFNAFVFHGQTAVLSVGRAVPSASGAALAWFGLAVDHRVVDGAGAARYLQTLQTEIQRQ
jgi:pyruvate dehydrogenase E2 component (dihydrolipoamide acetyltransferase)